MRCRDILPYLPLILILAYVITVSLVIYATIGDKLRGGRRCPPSPLEFEVGNSEVDNGAPIDFGLDNPADYDKATTESEIGIVESGTTTNIQAGTPVNDVNVENTTPGRFDLSLIEILSDLIHEAASRTNISGDKTTVIPSGRSSAGSVIVNATTKVAIEYVRDLVHAAYSKTHTSAGITSKLDSGTETDSKIGNSRGSLAMALIERLVDMVRTDDSNRLTSAGVPRNAREPRALNDPQLDSGTLTGTVVAPGPRKMALNISGIESDILKLTAGMPRNGWTKRSLNRIWIDLGTGKYKAGQRQSVRTKLDRDL